MLIQRQLAEHILEASREFPVVAILGPRQSGKTTLAQITFPYHRYISLEDYDVRALAQADPRQFLTEYPTDSGVILDEIQHVPELLSYMQTIVDRDKKKGKLNQEKLLFLISLKNWIIGKKQLKLNMLAT